MMAIQGVKPTSSHLSSSRPYTNGTIRSVPSEPQQSDISYDDSRRDGSGKDLMPRSFRSYPTRLSTDINPSTTYVNGNISESVLSEDSNPPSNTIPQWNSAIGRASLGGKSGRVIERLMCENDMLKRDLNIEQLRAEEQKQAVKMTEGKMEALILDYDSRLHDAAVNKTLLKRRERQLAELRTQVDTEKKKAQLATENEKTWKDQIEKVEQETKRNVEDALLYASMMEGRNNVLSSHWKEQGLEFERTIKKLSKEIAEITLERKHDDERLNTLQGLCDQQAAQLAQIVEERNAISRNYEECKRLQEETLLKFKAAAQEQEEKSERLMTETLKALNDLKWALGVHKSDRKS
ncbi:hypothetical protein K3495_g2003 [Podosphaera aphanis]|nr:hypothetical protein K3495_g2003 [Podosphaera aphanis]